MKQLHFSSLFLLILIPYASFALGFQFCTPDHNRQADLCIAVTSYYNSSTADYDIYMHISSSFSSGKGWSAVAPGRLMDEALMFIMYPSESGIEAILSVRSTNGHNPPIMAKDAPDVQVLNSMVDADGLYNVFLVCFACNTWTGAALHVDSQRQPWIWAVGQNARSDDPNSSIFRHTDYGLFFTDMTSSQTSKGGPLLPQVGKSRASSGIYNSDAESWISSHKSAVRTLHGLLGLCVVALLPIGIFRIRSSSPSAFSQHRAIQFGMAASCVLAIVLGLLLSIHSNTYHDFHTSHQWLGLLLGGFIPAQIALGYRHHINHMRTRKKGQTSIAHVILGHYIWAFLTINAFLGLYLVYTGFNLVKLLLAILSCIPLFTV